MNLSLFFCELASDDLSCLLIIKSLKRNVLVKDWFIGDDCALLNVNHAGFYFGINILFFIMFYLEYTTYHITCYSSRDAQELVVLLFFWMDSFKLTASGDPHHPLLTFIALMICPTSWGKFSLVFIYITLKCGKLAASGQICSLGVPSSSNITNIWLISESPLKSTFPSASSYKMQPKDQISTPEP